MSSISCKVNRITREWREWLLSFFRTDIVIVWLHLSSSAVCQESFARAKNWVKELQRQASPNIVIALAGNKADLANKRALDFQVRAGEFANEHYTVLVLFSMESSYNLTCKAVKHNLCCILTDFWWFSSRMPSHTQMITVYCSWKHQQRPLWTLMRCSWLLVSVLCSMFITLRLTFSNFQSDNRNTGPKHFPNRFTAKKLPKNEPQAEGANSGRNRGVDLTEAAQPASRSCCST